jgi:hypothetical protein
MAEFCKQCSTDTFAEDYEDFAGMSKPEDTANKLYPVVLCEGCGPCQVDHTGKCISTDCLKKHGEK